MAPKIERLYLRIPRNHEWRNLTLAGVRDAVVRKAGYSPNSISHILPVACGFALVSKNEPVRQHLLSSSSHLPPDLKLEAQKNWVKYMLPNIPTHIVSSDGRVIVSEKEIICEIERFTSAIVKIVRHEGKTKCHGLTVV